MFLNLLNNYEIKQKGALQLHPQAAAYTHMDDYSRRTAGASQMSGAALILGLISLLLIATGFSIILGALGIILALLSRGSGPLSGRAKAGLITSALGIFGGIAVVAVTYITLFSGDPEQAMERLNTLYNTYIEQGSLDSDDIDEVLEDPAAGSDSDTDTDTNTDTNTDTDTDTNTDTDANPITEAGGGQLALSVILPDGEEVKL